MDQFWKKFIEWLDLIRKLGQNHILILILGLDKKQTNNFGKE